MTLQQPVDVAIVGGGITGLAAAWFLEHKAPGISYTLLESGDRWGGKVRTDRVEGYGDEPFIVEGGPDSFLTTKPWAWQLSRRLNLQDQALPTSGSKRTVYVLNKGQSTPLPDGVMLIVPTKIKPFALSPLISPLGKLRMGLDLFIAPKKDGEDETLAEFIRRRLGSEALDKIAEPLMSGIYNAESERQSLLATFPRFREIEEQHGSLIRGMVAGKTARATSPSANGQANGTKPPSAFVSFNEGMETIVDALLEELDGDLQLDAPVSAVHHREADGLYELELADRTIRAQAVILAVPSFVAADLLEEVAPETAVALREIRYVSTGTISLAYDRKALDHPLNGTGIVIPRSEKRRINAITWSSSKFAHRAPEGSALLRVFFGGSRTPEMMEYSDSQLETIVREELQQIMGIKAAPLFIRVYRNFRANPQYDVGHLDRLQAIEQGLPSGLFVSGSPYRGIGLPDCIKQAEATVEEVLAEIQQKIYV